jgi:D-amino-acid dehydrogenase
VVCSRLGQHLRVAGTAELNGFDLSPNPERSAALVRWLEEHFPAPPTSARLNTGAGCARPRRATCR